jgi:hypothetical protein
MLPELTRIKELRVLGPRYYPIRFNKHHAASDCGGGGDFDELRSILLTELLVKQRNGYFSYAEDPADEKAFNVRNFLNKVIIPHKVTPDLLEQITNEPHVNLFAKMLNKCNHQDTTTTAGGHKINRLLKLIYESVVQETFEFVGIMLLLDREASAEQPSSQFIQQIKLLNNFYRNLISTKETNAKTVGKKRSLIITLEFLHFLINSLETKLNDRIKSE